MQRDIRDHDLYREAESIYSAIRGPGTGQIWDAAELQVMPDGASAVFVGTFADSLEAPSNTRICQVDLRSGETRVLTSGPNCDRSPKPSPDGQSLAFLSDRHRSGDFQLYLLDLRDGRIRAASGVEGWIECIHWSPSGERLLLAVAGHGADRASTQGAIATRQVPQELPAWMPEVKAGPENFMWRRLWLYESKTGDIRQIASENINVWEASWCGENRVAVIGSHGPTEGHWYEATVQLVGIEGSEARAVYEPCDQLGGLAASPSGRYVAVIESVCSDRGLIAGNLRIISIDSGAVKAVNARGVDVSHVEWRSEDCLLVAGHRGLETVVAVYHPGMDSFLETWSDTDSTTNGFHAVVSGLGTSGDCALLGESFHRAPHVAVIRDGKYAVVRSFDIGYEALAASVRVVERMEWSAPDGVLIQGWLLRPREPAPHPVVMCIHGGPVWHWRAFFLGRHVVHLLMLLRRGHAVFFPNPRGSSGRGQAFAREVIGDMGGKDALDCLSGLDYLIARNVADPKRLGVTGASYGGYMCCWLVTQDHRFAAAVPIAPITNHVTEHLLSNIPHFAKLFLADELTDLGGQYFRRSPVMHAHNVRTPVLTICGGLDACTPASEGLQFHSGLIENGGNSVLATYPQEGHGIRGMPAAIDFTARVTLWFEKHLECRA